MSNRDTAKFGDPRKTAQGEADVAEQNSGLLLALPFQGVSYHSTGLSVRSFAARKRGMASLIAHVDNGSEITTTVDLGHPLVKQPLDLPMLVDSSLGVATSYNVFRLMGQASMIDIADAMTRSTEIRQEKGIRDPAYSWLTLMQAYMQQRWSQENYPCVRLGIEQAAALATTATSPDMLTDILPPWDTFLIAVPEGLLANEGALSEDIRWVMVHSAILAAQDVNGLNEVGYKAKESERRWWFYAFSDKDNPVLTGTCLTTGNLGSAQYEQTDSTERTERNLQLIGQLIQGVCLELARGRENISPKRPKGMNAVTWAKRHTAQEYQLLADVRIYPGLAEEVRALSRQAGPVTVRTIVRRHRKRQACGKGRMDRKWIVVEPYVRGQGPIGVRQHALK